MSKKQTNKPDLNFEKSQESEKSRTDKFFDGLSMIMGRFGMLGSIVSGVAGMFKSLRLEMERKQGLITATEATAKKYDLSTGQYRQLRQTAVKNKVGEERLGKSLTSAFASIEKAQMGKGEMHEILKKYGVFI